MQFGVKYGAGFGKVMFASDAAAAAAGIEELNAALKWVEGELAKSEGPFFLGKEFTLVSTQYRVPGTVWWGATAMPKAAKADADTHETFQLERCSRPGQIAAD